MKQSELRCGDRDGKYLFHEIWTIYQGCGVVYGQRTVLKKLLVDNKLGNNSFGVIGYL